MAIVTSSQYEAYDKALALPNNADAIADKRSSTRTTALVADVLGGATALAAGLTILAFALTSGERSTATTATATKVTPPRPTWRPVLGPEAMGGSSRRRS